jgi:hypothetical protein
LFRLSGAKNVNKFAFLFMHIFAYWTPNISISLNTRNENGTFQKKFHVEAGLNTSTVAL